MVATVTGMTDRNSSEEPAQFVERFTSLTDPDVRRLALWTRALLGDQPSSGREWRAAASREFNSVGRHRAQVAYQEAIDEASVMLARDVRLAASLDALLSRLGDAATSRQVTRDFAWRGRSRALWLNRFGLVALIGCFAFLAGAIGAGLGGRDDLLAVMGLIAFGLVAVGLIPYVAWPLSPPTEIEARAALGGPILAIVLKEKLSPSAYELLIDPWRRAIDAIPPADPPMRWRTAVLAGRVGLAAMMGGVMVVFSAAWLQQLAR